MTVFGPDDLAFLEENTVLIRPLDIQPTEYIYVLQQGVMLTGMAVRERAWADAWVSRGTDRTYTRIAVRDLVE